MDAIRIAAASLYASTARMDRSAQRIASGEGDLATEIVEEIEAKATAGASAAVIHAGEQSSEHLTIIGNAAD